MTSSIIGILVAAASSVGAYFAWKNSASHQRKLAEQKIDEEASEHARVKAEIEQAVYSHNDDTVNTLVNHLLEPVLLFVVFGAAFIGCHSSPTTVYIASDRRIVSITNDYGVACKAVPDLVFAEMLVKLKELEDMKKELKVESRLSTPKK